MRYKSVMKGEVDFSLKSDGLIRFRNQIYVPRDAEINSTLLKEAHQTAYSLHPGETKMIKDVQ